MDEERTIEKSPRKTHDGLEESVEAFHEAKVEAAGVRETVEVLDVATEFDESAVFLRVTDGAVIGIRPDDDLPRAAIADRLNLPPGHGLADLPGESIDLFFDRGDGVVRSREDGPVIGSLGDEVGAVMPSDVDEFDRMMAIERGLDHGTPPSSTTRLEADGDGERVHLEAEIGTETVEWTLPIPAPTDFEDGELTALVDDLDVGDPGGLDGHRATVCLADALDERVERYTSDCGTVAIVPPGELADGTDSETDSNELTPFGMDMALFQALLWTLITGMWLFQAVAFGEMWTLFVSLTTAAVAILQFVNWRLAA